MNECTSSEMQDLLPDLEHGTLDVAVRQMVEAHLAGCESCREDLRIIRTVKSATIFAPSIDAERVVRQIAPYPMPALPREAPARTKVVQWLLAATVGVLLIGGGAMLKNRQQPTASNVAFAPDSAIVEPESVALLTPTESRTRPAFQVHTPALALAADVRELTDGNLQQLMDDLESFDALPNSEPEPVFAVDTSEGR